MVSVDGHWCLKISQYMLEKMYSIVLLIWTKIKLKIKFKKN
jgi:hypothetical protein